MFEGKSLVDILEIGGPVLWVLLMLSVASLTVICYKVFELWRKGRIARVVFMPTLFDKIKTGSLDKAVEYCNSVDAPIAAVAKAGIVAFKTGESLGEFMDREIMIQTVELERYMTVLGTVGNIAVYIGLLGTVIGIIGAFGNMSSSEGGGGISVLIGSISEALTATATGLFVAIPASTAYNFLTKKIDKFVVGMEYCASAIEDKFNLNK